MDELETIDELCARHGPVFRRRPGVVYVADPTEAKAILANEDGRYRDDSDFFHTSKGTFGPRQSQREIAAAAVDLLQSHWSGSPATTAEGRWPDAGNLLLYRCFRDTLVPPGELRVLVDQVVHHAFLTTPRRRPPMTALRTRVRRALVAELSRRRSTGDRRTLLDILATAAQDGSSYTTLAQLSEVYLSFVNAVAGWLGYALGWSLYLLATTFATPVTPSAIAHEALRLWPIRWQLNRHPTRPHRVGPLPVTPTDEIVVCPYLIHRDKTYWPAPETFRPTRWPAPTSPYLPFGWGPHSCPAATLTITILSDLLRHLPPTRHLTPQTRHPHITATLAPPPFTLHLP